METVENEFGQSFDLMKFIIERNSTIGIYDQITSFPVSGIHIQGLIYAT